TLFKILAEFDLGIGEFFEDAARETFTPRDVQIVRQLKTLPADVRREVEELIARKHEPGDANEGEGK
ncbi:MAG TPA: hypothetical protein VN923_07920, partial [Thermoanaerobaculia bacterium]|nr:hypothetical protein [Thermoanaerobaculia bacterium]